MRACAVAVLDLLFPAVCPLCAATLGPGRRDPLCGGCYAGIERIVGRICAACGRPLGASPAPDGDGAWASERCGACAAAPPPFAYARAAALYAGPAREALHALKFRNERALARPLARLVVEECARALPGDVAAVIPVPLSRARERARGYNQSALIAARVAAALAVPVRRRWLTRRRDTRPQTDLTATERRANVMGAFAASRAAAGRRVVLVDDVFTTGATVTACVEALCAAGAREVGVLTVARVL